MASITLDHVAKQAPIGLCQTISTRVFSAQGRMQTVALLVSALAAPLIGLVPAFALAMTCCIAPVMYRALANCLQYQASLDKQLQRMVKSREISQDICQRLVETAGAHQIPFAFYQEVDRLFSRGQLTAESALNILSVYDRQKKYENRIAKTIHALVAQNQMTPEDAYLAYQTYRIVRSDLRSYHQAVDLMTIPKGGTPSSTQILSVGQSRNIRLYQQTRWRSNHEARLQKSSEQLRQEVYVSVSASVEKLPNPGHLTQIWTEEITTSSMAYKLRSHGYNPAMLDMADAYEAGGGVSRGTQAQEEDECKKSNLFEGLEAVYCRGGYPIPEFGTIVAPKVTFFLNDDYSTRWVPFQTTVIASAAYDRKNKGEQPWIPCVEKRNVKEKMRSVLRAAVRNGNDSVALSAFGCGAFGNSTPAVARLYREVLSEGEFVGRFKAVAFAVINDRNGGKNFETFKGVFPDKAPM